MSCNSLYDIIQQANNWNQLQSAGPNLLIYEHASLAIVISLSYECDGLLQRIGHQAL